jgi:hypothetical protein
MRVGTAAAVVSGLNVLKILDLIVFRVLQLRHMNGKRRTDFCSETTEYGVNKRFVQACWRTGVLGSVASK